MNQRAIRHYAWHLALIVRTHGKVLTLSERYNDNGYHRRRIGTYRSWAGVLRAIKHYHHAELARCR